MNSAIEAKRLTCGYHQRTVLDSLSLEIRPGEVLVLLGPNGCGKTTLLRSLARFLRPRSGSVILDDRDIWSIGPEETARNVAMMPQTERRDWPLTVEESVRLGRAPHRGWYLPFTEQDQRIVDGAIVDTGLDLLRERPITELSGGEWRRMIFARALVQQAQILLLDEPTAGLDLKYQHDVLRLVRDLAKSRGLSVVITLHDFNHAALYADRLAMIADKKLVALGTPGQVITADLIHQVYGVEVTIIPHPVYHIPMVVPMIASDRNREVS